ncbi:MAG TPA: hypothetical protein VGG91_15050 [Myxococcaceae bacterium]
MDVSISLIGTHKAERDAAMWDTFGDQTITVTAHGARYLSAICQAARRGR